MSCLRSLAIVWTSLQLVACNGATNVDIDGSGTLTAALTTTGPDGNLYRLPPVSFLSAFRNGEHVGYLNLEGDEATKSFTLVTGSYTSQVREFTAAGDPTGVNWTLLRGAEQTPVSAVLQNPDPTFEIVEGETTSLVLHFALADIGDVVFTVGNLDVSMDVSAGTATPATRLVFSGPITINESTANGAQSLVDFLVQPVGTTIQTTVTLEISSWRWSVDTICTGGTPTITSDPQPEGFAALLTEPTADAATVQGALCFTRDQRVYFQIWRYGEALTTGLASRLPAGQKYFDLTATFALTEPVWDGETLKLSALGSGMDVTSDTFDLRAYAIDPAYEPIANARTTAVHRLRALP